MSLYTPSSPHFHGNNSVSRTMLLVVAALIPGIAVYALLFGWGILFNLLLTIVLALGLEALMLIIRKRPLQPFLSDGSALVTACLLALSIPPIAPWWTTLVGVFFAIVVAKHLYGGLGYNPFNPAMAGYAILLVSFPVEMTAWPAALSVADVTPGFTQSLSLIFSGQAAGIPWDSITGATPLDYLKTQLSLDKSAAEVLADNDVFGALAGKGFEWVNLAFLLGGLFLIYKKVISWHIPAAVLGSLLVISLGFHLAAPEHYASPLFHLFGGAAILGAFFIATDPVSASTTPLGRIIYGAGIGLLIYVIRAWGGYPDGVAFAVLLLNLCAPTIDYYTKPRVFGYERKED